MNTHIVFAVKALFLFFIPLRCAADSSELARLTDMTLIVEQRGVGDFLAIAKKFGWESPSIHTAFWVSELSKDNPEVIRIEESKRAFGKALSKGIDIFCMDVLTKVSVADRKRQVDVLLSLAEWVKVPHSYGNLLLFTRAENLAATPMGHLVADLNVPLVGLGPFFKRFTTDDIRVEIRRAVMNDEARRQIVGKLFGSVQKRTDALDLAWANGYRSARLWCERRGIKGMTVGEKLRPLIDPELRVFCDDEDNFGDARRTTSEHWDFKEVASTCVFGTQTTTLQLVQALALFREKIGYFPDKAPSWWKEGDRMSHISAVFLEAWTPFRKQFGNIDGSAAEALEQIRANRLFDEETKLVLGDAYKGR